MQFVHTSDWHIGGSTQLPGYLARQEEMLDSIFDIARTRGIETVVVAGDIFDSSDPEPAARDLLLKKLLQFDQEGFRILMMPGNHDLADSTGRTALSWLHILTEEGRFQNSVVTEKTQIVRVGDVTFVLFVHSPGQFRLQLEQLVHDMTTCSLEISWNDVVFVLHECINGALSDTNFRLHGAEIPTELGTSLPDLPVNYVALGDIHKAQRMGQNAWYCGSPVQIKFGDPYPKGVLVVDTQANKGGLPVLPEFVPIWSSPLKTVTVEELLANPEDYQTGKIKVLGNLDDETRDRLNLDIVRVVRQSSVIEVASTDNLVEDLRQAVTGQFDQVYHPEVNKEIDSLVAQVRNG